MYGIDTWGKIAFDDVVQVLGRGLYSDFLVQGSFEGIDVVAVYGCVIARSSWTALRSMQYGVVPKLVSSRKELFYLGVLGDVVAVFSFLFSLCVLPSITWF